VIRKSLLCLAILFAIPFASGAQIVCVDFDDFCDGLQLHMSDETGAVILYGTWENYDCVGSEIVVMGNSCEEGFSATMTDPNGPIIGSAFDFWFESTSRTFDLVGLSPPDRPQTFQDDAGYTIIPGTCDFSDKNDRPASTW